jgi:translation initiation factor 2 subunit 1
MVKVGDYPEEGELVVGTVTEVEDYGAFCDLEQYPGREGFVHISEVASGWVKYVRDHVQEEQKIVCKVLGIDESKGHVDLSLKQVNEHQRDQTISRWKDEQKAENLWQLLADRVDRDPEELYEEVGEELADVYGGLYPAFEAAAIEEDALGEDGFEGPWVDAFVDLAQENISIPFVKIKGYVKLESPAPDGIDHIRDALVVAEETEFEDVEIEAQYMGAPNYRLIVQAPDYKAAEDELSEAADRALDSIREDAGTGEFYRELDELQQQENQ